MANATEDSPDQHGVVFLGFCHRISHVQEGNTGIYHWNILGLRNIVLSYIFPIVIDEWWIGLALRIHAMDTVDQIRISGAGGRVVASISLTQKDVFPSDEDALLRGNGPIVPISENGWTLTFFALPKGGFVVPAPGTYLVEQLFGETSQKIGTVDFVVANPPMLTEDRLTAIKSDPGAAKAIRTEIGCKCCASKSKAYAALERNANVEEEGWKWYQSLPDYFKCECGKNEIDLQYIRCNLHGLLGSRWAPAGEVEFVPLYHASALRSSRNDFASLVSRNPKEETIQKFIQENPVLMHQFPAVRIISKPKILNFHVADFGIITPNKELLLVELEKSNILLMKKNGGIASPLSHAFDQVRDWLHEADEHRLALLNSLDVHQDEVSVIRGVVIAGRDSGYDAKNLRKLKGADWGRFTFLTYDDLIFAMDALIHRVESL